MSITLARAMWQERGGAGKSAEPAKEVRHRQQHPVRLATLNVGTLSGGSRKLADSLRKLRVDICCEQEIRRKGSKSRESGDDYKLIYHGRMNRIAMALVLYRKRRLETASHRWIDYRIA
ncbi:hypothetical protein RB195_006210 [Necator americanus]|uniref:Endonuclease/exonuclease/phosphatase domain-containing protein n=1 Tax=Necator americanus TaxID=51031 RepID=A0ABR1BRI1_NECAM